MPPPQVDSSLCLCPQPLEAFDLTSVEPAFEERSDGGEGEYEFFVVFDGPESDLCMWVIAEDLADYGRFQLRVLKVFGRLWRDPDCEREPRAWPKVLQTAMRPPRPLDWMGER